MITIGGDNIREDDLIMIGEIQLEDGSQFFSVIREHLLSLMGDPMFSMLDLREEDIEPGGVTTVDMLVASAKFKDSSKVCWGREEEGRKGGGGRKGGPGVKGKGAVLIPSSFLQEIAKLLFRLINCKVKEFFYKLNVHAGEFERG